MIFFVFHAIKPGHHFFYRTDKVAQLNKVCLKCCKMGRRPRSCREGQGITPRVFLHKDKIATVQHTGLKVVNKHVV